MQDDLSEDEEKTQPAILHLLHPVFHARFHQHELDSAAAGSPEQINSQAEHYGIDQSRYQYPLPQAVFYYKTMRMKIGLYGNDDLFEHD